MSNNRGATLVELMVAMVIMLIVALGFFSWADNMTRMNISIDRSNNAYAVAVDVADRLQRMYDNALIKPKSGNTKYVGYVPSGTDIGRVKGCDASNDPTVSLTVSGKPDLNKFADPITAWNAVGVSTGTRLYLYDKNNCADKAWTDSNCGGTGTSTITAAGKVTVTTGSSENIDHPDPSALVSAYDSISPIRFYKGTTYYAVWSVAYMPCNATDTNRRKIFITVYWIDPEPTETTAADVVTKINSGAYTLKSVSLVVDKVIGTET